MPFKAPWGHRTRLIATSGGMEVPLYPPLEGYLVGSEQLKPAAQT